MNDTTDPRPLMMRFLLFERQVVVVVRFGNRPDSTNNGPPVSALVIAVENVAIRRAGEERITPIPNIHRHAFDVAPDVLGQSVAQDVPALATVATARDPCIRGMQFSPSAWTRLRSCDEQQIGVARVNKKRIHVADPKIARRHALPASATVRAYAKTSGNFRPTVRGWRCAINFAGIGFGNQNSMRVRVYVVDRCPRLAAVAAS